VICKLAYEEQCATQQTCKEFKQTQNFS